MEIHDWKPLFAEAIATFALVFIGAGAVTANYLSNGALGLLGIAFAHGLALMSMIYATGHISGAHINPAVTIALFAVKKIELKNAVGYIIAQLFGAAVAGLLLLALFPAAVQGIHLGATSLATGIGPLKGTLIEAVLTFFLVFTIFGAAVDPKGKVPAFGIAIGMVLVFDILVGGMFTGAAMNPARSFGPGLASGFWENHLVYWAGPIIGALAAAIAYKFGIGLEEKNKK